MFLLSGITQVCPKLSIFFKKKYVIDYPTCVFAGIASSNMSEKSKIDFIVRSNKGKIINLV